MNSKKSLLLLILICLISIPESPAKSKIPSSANPPSLWFKSPSIRYSTAEIQVHLKLMNTSIPMDLSPAVEKRINALSTRGRIGVEYFLGNGARYFPIFEEKLKAAGLPKELKFLPVVESGLNPKGVSGKGAAGFWQLMPGTAIDYGLQVNQQVDERLDIHKSTEAAIHFLSDLYDDFGDWKLAIAAYNCGPVRVKKAVKRKKSKEFKKIKNLLPRETRQYIEKYTATAYLMTYYSFYNLRPRYSDYNLQYTQVSLIYDRSSFKALATDSGVPVAIIRELNPSYIRGYIPESTEGNFLILPKYGVSASFNDSSRQILGSR